MDRACGREATASCPFCFRKAPCFGECAASRVGELEIIAVYEHAFESLGFGCAFQIAAERTPKSPLL